MAGYFPPLRHPATKMRGTAAGNKYTSQGPHYENSALRLGDYFIG